MVKCATHVDLHKAEMPDDLNIYLEMPENFGCSDGSDSILKLKKSLYGSTVAPRLWYEKLKGGLIDQGFAMCTADPCMFIRKDCIVQLYLDGVIWTGIPSDSPLLMI